MVFRIENVSYGEGEENEKNFFSSVQMVSIRHMQNCHENFQKSFAALSNGATARLIKLGKNISRFTKWW